MNDPKNAQGGEASGAGASAGGGGGPGKEPLEITTFYPRDVEVLELRSPTVPSYFPRRPVRSNRRLAAVLFVATCISVFAAGLMPGKGVTAFYNRDRSAPPLPSVTELVKNGAIYFGCVMAILISHEMGHYLQARRYKVPATLPYFIPFPVTPFGTMGAVIVQGAGVANRKALFDIAVSGPLAGLVFALPITMFALSQAHIEQSAPPSDELSYGMPLIFQWLLEWIRGPLPPGTWLADDPWLFAGWVGIFITALNLIPIGQLDGGHILYTLIGRRAHAVAIGLMFAALAFMIRTGQVSYGLMLVLLFVAGPRHPPTADDRVPLGLGRIVLGWLTLAFVIIGFTPVPISMAVPVERRQPPPRQVPSDTIEVRAPFNLLTRPSASS